MAREEKAFKSSEGKVNFPCEPSDEKGCYDCECYDCGFIFCDVREEQWKEYCSTGKTVPLTECEVKKYAEAHHRHDDGYDLDSAVTLGTAE